VGDAGSIRAAEVVVPCVDLAAAVAFYTGELGFRLEAISPADDPAVAVIAGHGVRLRLDRFATEPAGTLRLLCDGPLPAAAGSGRLVAPNGTAIELIPFEPPLDLPPVLPSLVVTRARQGAWGTGRAGMQYRDLIPDRLGGHLIASHIRIPDGGPVPDHVHHHRIRFQLVYCRRGWVRVVYEDQGSPFELRTGDCVLQPPGIRHRVLESSPGLEVIEITAPARHDTSIDHDLALPTATVNAERRFAGQTFVRHQATTAIWQAVDGGEFRDLGITAASDGFATAVVLRPVGSDATAWHDDRLTFGFVLSGAVELVADRRRWALGADDAFVAPGRRSLTQPSPDLELLLVTLQVPVRRR
jgi:mannose-6-phosphate isomerase-like protein (cupin superfamily)